MKSNPETSPSMIDPQILASSSRRRRWDFLVLALTLFLSVGYFQNSRPGWNVNSQFALTCALVETGSFSIDNYHEHPDFNTGDKALYEGRFYSDKSPVTPMLGVPAFFVYRLFAGDGSGGVDYVAARYWTTWLTMGSLLALLGVLLAGLFMRHGLSSSVASVLAGLWLMATPLFGYSILFFNYVPAAAMAMGGYLLIESDLRDSDLRGSSRTALRWFLGGALLGLASWTLATFALLALLLTIALVAWGRKNILDESGEAGLYNKKFILAFSCWVAGGIVGASGYAFYSLAIFGEIASPYRYEFNDTFRDKMAQGLMGASWPDWRVLMLITVHPFRGLFVLFPATAAASLGLIVLLRDRSLRPASTVALWLLAGLLLYNSGYFMWWGGWSYAPRHLIPALPLMAVGLLPWLRTNDGQRRSIFVPATLFVLLIATAILNVSVVALDPQLSPGLLEVKLSEEQLYEPALIENWPKPFFEALRYVKAGQTDPNWGTRMGLAGFASLFPLLLLWSATLAFFGWRSRSSDQK